MKTLHVILYMYDFCFTIFPQGRFIMSNKVARTIAFFYTLLLHSLVFLVRLAINGETNWLTD